MKKECEHNFIKGLTTETHCDKKVHLYLYCTKCGTIKDKIILLEENHQIVSDVNIDVENINNSSLL